MSLLILTFTAPSIFLGYIAGVYVDQLSLKKVMLATNLVRALAILLLLIFGSQIYLVFLIVFALSVATLFFIPAEGSAVPSLVVGRQLIAANGLFSFSYQTSLVVGFLIGGFSLRILGEQQTTWAIFVLFVVSLALNLWLPKSIRSESSAREQSILKRFIGGIVFVFSTKKVRDSIFFLTLTTTIVFMLAAIGPGYVDKVLGLDVKYVATFVVLPATAGMALGSFVLGHIGNRFDERKLINFGLFGLGVTFLLLSSVGEVNLDLAARIMSLALLFLIGLANALITVPTTTNFQKATPENLRGRAYGLMGTFVSGVAALPVLVSGAVGDIYGVRSVLVVLGILVTGFGIYRLRPKG
nr:hypothetical protein [uncultured archaeon]